MKIIRFVIIFLFFSYTAKSQVVKDTLVSDKSTEIKKLQFYDLNNVYNDNAFDYDEKLSVNKLSWWERFKIWLSHKLSELFKIGNPDKTFKILEWIFKIGGILLVLFVIYKIIQSFLKEDGRWIFSKKSERFDLSVKDLEQQVLSTDFEKLIKEAVQKNQFRLAIRYYYLLVLQKLNQKELIQWQYEKTNRDYYNELKNSDLKNKFRYVSYLYDYAWYGEFELNTSEFEKGEQSFHQLLKAL